MVNTTVTQNTPVLMFNLEMSKEMIIGKILSIITKKKLQMLPTYIDDTPKISIKEIILKSKELKKEKDIGLIIIDYLQLVDFDNQQQIANELKALTHKLNIPIIVISQLSMEVDKRIDNTPILEDIRNKHLIEQADTIMLLSRNKLEVVKEEY